MNGLLLNADMSEAICLGTSTQLRSPSTAVDSVRRFVWRIFMQSASNALRHGSNSFTCKLHHACFYSPAAEHHRPLAGTHFTVPRRVKG